MTTPRPMIVSLLLATAFGGAGCTHWIELAQPVPDAASDVLTVSINDRVPVVIEAVRSTQNGAPMSTSSRLERQILGAIEDTRLFSESFQSGYAQPMADRLHVKARVSIQETVDPHAGEAAFKGIVIGASMFLLAPVIQLQYGYGSDMTLEIERWDGQIKQYNTSATGTAHYNLFGANPHVIDELKGQVIDRCLTTLLQQVVHDTSFYLASATQTFGSPIRNVAVTGRRGGLRPIPVSTPEPAQQ